jgi:hypothetical protein
MSVTDSKIAMNKVRRRLPVTGNATPLSLRARSD